MDAIINFIPHQHSPLLRLETPPRELLIQSLTNLVTLWPPGTGAHGERMGFYQGPTSIAYLFFHLSKTHPSLEIQGRVPFAWFEDYFSNGPAPAPRASNVGIASEDFCRLALEAAHTENAENFLSVVQALQLDNRFQELLLGNSGLLVLLRFVKTFVPTAGDRIDEAIKTVIDHINKSSWLFYDREYTGAVHGNVGIITQICLSGGASTVADRLYTFLSMQQEDGNWHSTTDRNHQHMQFCHGVPGCIISLVAIEKYFPDEPLAGRLRSAIERAQRLIFERGILRKEPCLCHGATGNALALDTARRDHLLTFTTPDAIVNGGYFESLDPPGLYGGEAGRAWVWAMLDGGRQGFPAFTDV